jgi:hypothetical protein
LLFCVWFVVCFVELLERPIYNSFMTETWKIS